MCLNEGSVQKVWNQIWWHCIYGTSQYWYTSKFSPGFRWSFIRIVSSKHLLYAITYQKFHSKYFWNNWVDCNLTLVKWSCFKQSECQVSILRATGFIIIVPFSNRTLGETYRLEVYSLRPPKIKWYIVITMCVCLSICPHSLLAYLLINYSRDFSETLHKLKTQCIDKHIHHSRNLSWLSSKKSW